MRQKKRLVICAALILSVLCGSGFASAADKPQGIITQQEVQMPMQIQAKALENGGIQLTWEAVSDATGYRVYRWNRDIWELLHVIKHTEKTSYIDKTTEMQTEYKYMLRAYTQTNGNILLSAPSEEVVATTTTVLGTPVMRAVTSNDPSSLTITWNAVGNATGYEVFPQSGRRE